MMRAKRRRPIGWRDGLLRVAFVILIAIGPARLAYAIPSCSGTYSATALNPLPMPNVVQYNAGAEGQTATAIANQFIAGMQSAGMAFAGQPTTQMNLTGSVSPASNTQGASATAGTYSGFGWAAQTSPGAAPIIGGTLRLSITLTDMRAATMDWLGNLTCIVGTNDKGQLAQELGAAIGRTIGQNFNERPF
jgi:hypothetical protein